MVISVKISGYFGENKGVILVVIFVKIKGYFNENNQVQLQHSMLWWQSRHVLVQRQRQQKKPGLQQQLPVVGSVAKCFILDFAILHTLVPLSSCIVAVFQFGIDLFLDGAWRYEGNLDVQPIPYLILAPLSG